MPRGSDIKAVLLIWTTRCWTAPAVSRTWIHHGRDWDIAAPPPDYVIAGAWEVGDMLGISAST